MKRNNVNIIDQCGIYKEFSSKEDFNKNFHASMEDRFEQLARQYDLDDPRVGYNEKLQSMWKEG